MLDLAAAHATRPESSLHGLDHWRRVAANGCILAAQTPDADAAVVAAFAAFHDACRVNDGDDPGHGARGAKLAADLRAEGLVDLTDSQFALLEEACRRHTEGSVTSDPTIGCCWDADRLDLPRCGITPAPRFLSTAAARGRCVENPPLVVEKSVEPSGQTAARRRRELRAQSRRLDARLGPDTSAVACTLPDGWTIREVTTHADQYREGRLMRNCLRYQHWLGVVDPDCWSLRDPDNLPHATFAVWETVAGADLSWIPADTRLHCDGHRYYIRTDRAVLVVDANRPLKPAHKQRLIDFGSYANGCYFHGGAKGVPVGGLLLPAVQTGSNESDRRNTRYREIADDFGARVDDGAPFDPDYVNFVYFTTHRTLASVYAFTAGAGGAVYRVQPEGPIEHDPDSHPGAYRAPQARVLEVMKPGVVDEWLALNGSYENFARDAVAGQVTSGATQSVLATVIAGL